MRVSCSNCSAAQETPAMNRETGEKRDKSWFVNREQFISGLRGNVSPNDFDIASFLSRTRTQMQIQTQEQVLEGTRSNYASPQSPDLFVYFTSSLEVTICLQDTFSVTALPSLKPSLSHVQDA